MSFVPFTDKGIQVVLAQMMPELKKFHLIKMIVLLLLIFMTGREKPMCC